MAIRFIFEFDTPEEAARMIAQLPGLALSPPALPPPLPGQAKLDMSLRYEAYKANGGRLTFLGWANCGQPMTPADEVDQTPFDQRAARRLPASV
jgi:hypothetical protein